MIKAVVFDIDGTLTDMERQLDPLSMKAISRLDVPAILATGNVHCFTRAAAILLGASLTFISENGGVISYEDGPLEILADVSLCKAAYERLKEVYPLQMFDNRYRVTDIVLKRDFDLEGAIRHLEKYGISVDLLDSEFAVHIKDRSVDKGKALLQVMDRLDLDPEEVAAVGDSRSDLPMFRVAGFSATVANASSEVKEAADYVSTAKYGKGAYEIVDRMICEGMFQSWSTTTA